MAIVGDSVLRNTIFVLAGACEALNETFTHLNHKYWLAQNFLLFPLMIRCFFYSQTVVFIFILYFLFFLSFFFLNVHWLKCVQAWNKCLFAQLPHRHPRGRQIEDTFLWYICAFTFNQIPWTMMCCSFVFFSKLSYCFRRFVWSTKFVSNQNCWLEMKFSQMR